MRKNEYMLSLAINNSWDTPQGIEETYFKDHNKAKEAGIKLTSQYSAQAFKIIKLTSGLGHYRTIGFFDVNGNYLR